MFHDGEALRLWLCEPANIPVGRAEFETLAHDMAYNDQCADAGFRCTPLSRFSNPNQTHDGNPLGVAGTQDTTAVDGPADAARALNDTSATVANFRQGRAVKVSFDTTAATATEGAGDARVTVRLDGPPGRDVTIELTATSTTGAWSGDYEMPTTLDFGPTENVKSFFVTPSTTTWTNPTRPSSWAFFETLLPAGVTAGSQDSATVTLRGQRPTPTAAPSISAVALSSDPGPDRVYSSAIRSR